MTYFAIEQALWGISQDPAAAAAFANDADRYLSSFNLSEDESSAIRNFDVRALADAGAAPLLIMQAWNAAQGPDEIGEYLRRMNGPAEHNQAR